MKFFDDGPDLPERLLQLHEDQCVVFFCGAGISYPAGLPGFADLTKGVYRALVSVPNASQRAALNAKQYDVAINLIESTVLDGRAAVVREIAKLLKPKRSIQNVTATHEALLQLGLGRDRRLRLVTTNFDGLFDLALAGGPSGVEIACAPHLPQPNQQWKALVYLHGRLPGQANPGAADTLVVSSADFGRAYLVERWAARFVSELFRNHTVCFVGYSLSDPVMRYMTDALAADRRAGEPRPEAFAFASFWPGKEKDAEDDWRARGVTPILYAEDKRHSRLHRTLHEWAAVVRDGVRGKERVVVEAVLAQPVGTTRQDDLVPKMLWALMDSTGLPAKRFAEMRPCPPLRWLEAFEKLQLGTEHLSLFKLPSPYEDTARFNLMWRPTDPWHSTPMAIADRGFREARFDRVMDHLSAWLVQHLGDRELLLWCVEQGGHLTEGFRWRVEHQLRLIEQAESQGDDEALAKLRAGGGAAIPSPMMRTLWRLLLRGLARSQLDSFDFPGWLNRVRRDGLTASARLELRAALAPRLTLKRPFDMSDYEPYAESETAGSPPEPRCIKDLVDWDVVLATKYVRELTQDLAADDVWQGMARPMLEDFSNLLYDAVDLMRELGGIDARSDHSYLHLPSIAPHPQNSGFQEWTRLVELSRDAWVAVAQEDAQAALQHAHGWWRRQYPLYRRLCFFAATHHHVATEDLALQWLLADDGWWLWSVETQREALRLLSDLASRLGSAQLAILEQAVLSGPPADMFRDDVDPDRLERLLKHEVWLRLAKMQAAGAELSPAAAARLKAIEAEHPTLRLKDDESDEFPVWMGGNDLGQFTSTPRQLSDLVAYLKAHPSTDAFNSDDWAEQCRESVNLTCRALVVLAKEDLWFEERWRSALQAWADADRAPRSWRLAPVVLRMPADVLAELAGTLSRWVQEVAKLVRRGDGLFVRLCERLLAVPYPEVQDPERPVGTAINHPIGHVTEALLRWWRRDGISDGQGLDEPVRTLFARICNPAQTPLRHGRVVMAASAITLFRVDAAWTTAHLLPLFDWERNAAEAAAAWEAFLWMPRRYQPLMVAMKAQFLATANHQAELGRHGRNYASLLAFHALDPGEHFSNNELALAMAALPPEALGRAADALVEAQNAAGEQREAHWDNRIAPFLQRVWPAGAAAATSAVCEAFARLAIAAGGVFHRALQAVLPWLHPIQNTDGIVHRLSRSSHCHQFPEDSLKLLASVISRSSRWPPSDLEACLQEISQAAPTLVDDARYIVLVNYLRQHGNGAALA